MYYTLKRSCYFLILLTVLFWFGESVFAHEEYPIINSGDVIKAGSELDYPPFSLVDGSGKASGFSVELLKSALEVEGLEVDYKVGPWPEVKKDLEDGNIRVLPLVGRTPEREAIFDFTVPYFSIKGAVYVRKDDNKIKVIEDLADKEFVELAGDNATEFIIRKNITNKLFTTGTFEEAFRLLSSGRHDAIIVSTMVGDEILKKLNIKNIKRLDIPLEGFTQNFCFAVREDDSDMLEKLNEGLSVIFANGTYERLQEKWFPKNNEEKTYTIEDLRKYGLFLLFFVTTISSIVSVILSRSQVKRKTDLLLKEISEKNILQENLMSANNEIEKKNKEIEKKNMDLEQTLSDFYTLRIGMQRDLELGQVEKENQKLKEKLIEIRKE